MCEASVHLQASPAGAPNRLGVVLAAVVATACAGITAPAGAQESAHGLGLQVDLQDPACAGQPLGGELRSVQIDSFQDTFLVTGMRLLVNPFGQGPGPVYVPSETGSLPIVEITGNAAATPIDPDLDLDGDGMSWAEGDFFDDAMPPNATLPVLIGRSGVMFADPDTGLVLPADVADGEVVVITGADAGPGNSYLVGPDDPNPLTTLGVIVFVDQCDMEPGMGCNPDVEGQTLQGATAGIANTPEIQPANSGPACADPDDPAVVTLLGDPGGMSLYEWTDPDGQVICSGNEAACRDVQVIPPQAPGDYEYCLRVVSPDGCEATACTTVTVYPSPEATADNTGPVCEGDPVGLLGGPDGMQSYSWTGPGLSSGEQNPTVPSAVAGEYCLTVTDANGCTDTACTLVSTAPPGGGGDIVWVVCDPDSSDSQLLVIDLEAQEITFAGPVHQNADIEAMTFFGDQVVGSKGRTDDDADLVSMDFETGQIEFLAEIDFGSSESEIVGMATDGSGVHWAYLQEIGFAVIEMSGTVGTYDVRIGCDSIESLGLDCEDIEGLAVSPEGDTLYAMDENGTIVQIDVATGDSSVLVNVSESFDDGAIENLELYSHTQLAFITEDGDDLEFSLYNILTGELSTTLIPGTESRDVEGLVFPPDGGCQPVVGACCLPDGRCAVASRVECDAAAGSYQGDASDCDGLEPETLVWAVHDDGLTDTQLFVMNLARGSVVHVGPVHDEADIEGLCVFGDGVVGISGDVGSPHHLVQIDFMGGALTFGDAVDLDESTDVTGMATDASGVHWAALDGIGLATVADDGSVSPPIELSEPIEGVAITADGTMLYAMSCFGDLYEISTATGQIEWIDDVSGSFDDDDFENLELYADNVLAFITEDGDDLQFTTYDIANRAILQTVVFADTGVDDVEALLIVVEAGCPTPIGACHDPDGSCRVMPPPECVAGGGEYQGDYVECTSQCPADLSGDGQVGDADLAVLMEAWGSVSYGPPDLDGDEIVGITDYLVLILAWGPCGN